MYQALSNESTLIQEIQGGFFFITKSALMF
jgi:hypothetical protein